MLGQIFLFTAVLTTFSRGELAVCTSLCVDIRRVRQEPLYRRFLKVPELPAYLEKSGNVGVAMDNLSVRFDQLDLVPKLIPIFRYAWVPVHCIEVS